VIFFTNTSGHPALDSSNISWPTVRPISLLLRSRPIGFDRTSVNQVDYFIILDGRGLGITRSYKLGKKHRSVMKMLIWNNETLLTFHYIHYHNAQVHIRSACTYKWSLVRVTSWAWEKVAQKIAQLYFCQNRYITCAVDESITNICASFVIGPKLPKVNSHPEQCDQMSLWKIHSKCSPNHIWSKLMHIFNSWVKWLKTVGYFSNFHVTAQCKQSPIGRKIAQSGHPDPEWPLVHQLNWIGSIFFTTLLVFTEQAQSYKTIISLIN
jgi:hypothetical protein